MSDRGKRSWHFLEIFCPLTSPQNKSNVRFIRSRSLQRLTIDDFGEEQRYIKSRLTLANVIVQIQFCNLKATIIRSRRHLRLLVRQRNDAAVNKGSSSRRLKKFYAKIRSQEEKTVTEKGNGRHSSGHLSVVRSSSLTLQMSGLISRSIVIQIRYSCDVMWPHILKRNWGKLSIIEWFAVQPNS